MKKEKGRYTWTKRKKKSGSSRECLQSVRKLTERRPFKFESRRLIYDVCERSSFEHIGSWMQSIKQHNTSDELYIVLVGNMVDKEGDRAVETAEGQT